MCQLLSFVLIRLSISSCFVRAWELDPKTILLMSSILRWSLLFYFVTTSEYYLVFISTCSAGVITFSSYCIADSWVFFMARSKFLLVSYSMSRSRLFIWVTTMLANKLKAKPNMNQGATLILSRGFTRSWVKFYIPCLSKFRGDIGTDDLFLRC